MAFTDTEHLVSTAMGNGTPSPTNSSKMVTGTVILDLDGHVRVKDTNGDIKTLADANIGTMSRPKESSNATKPTSVLAGEYWKTNTNIEYLYDGTNNLPLASSGLNDGDEWIDITDKSNPLVLIYYSTGSVRKIKENVTLEKNLSVEGNTIIGNASVDTLEVKATPTFKENATLEKNLSVQGNSTIGNASSDTLEVKATPTFRENVTLSKNLSVQGSTIIGNASSDTLITKATSTFQEGVILEKNISIQGNSTIGNASSDTLEVKATPTFRENTTCKKYLKVESRLQLGTDGDDDFIVATGGDNAISTYIDGTSASKIKPITSTPYTIDSDRAIVGIRTYKKTWDLPSSLMSKCDILGADCKSNIKGFECTVHLQGHIAIINVYHIIDNFSKAVPSDKTIDIRYKLRDIVAVFTPITKVEETMFAGIADIKENGIEDSPTFVLAGWMGASNQIAKMATGEVRAGSKNFTANRMVCRFQLTTRVEFS